MPQVHDIGPVFVHTMNYPDRNFPLVDRGETQEIEDPYRYGRSWVIRLPWSRRALVTGRWTSQEPEDSALRRAIRARDLDAV